MTETGTEVALWAAGIGAIGGIMAGLGGGYLGATIAGRRREEQARREHRTEVYSRYLATLAAWPLAVKLVGHDVEFTRRHLMDMREAEAQVALIASRALHGVLKRQDNEFLNEVEAGRLQTYEQIRPFVDRQRPELLSAMRGELGEDAVEEPFV